MKKDVLKMSLYIFKRGRVGHDAILAELNLGIVELLKFDENCSCPQQKACQKLKLGKPSACVS